jgi:hypothetical protein
MQPKCSQDIRHFVVSIFTVLEHRYLIKKLGLFFRIRRPHRNGALVIKTQSSLGQPPPPSHILDTLGYGLSLFPKGSCARKLVSRVEDLGNVELLRGGT